MTYNKYDPYWFKYLNITTDDYALKRWFQQEPYNMSVLIVCGMGLKLIIAMW